MTEAEAHREKLITTISEAWATENPGWNSSSSRREIAAIALDALPACMKYYNGAWVILEEEANDS